MANQFFKVRLWTHKEIVDEFLANYDKMDDDIKLEIPLKRIWVINNSEE
jgi:restriction system protein